MPDSLEIDGAKVPIRSDFRTALKIRLAFEDATLTEREKVLVLLQNLFGKGKIPRNIGQVFEKASWFIRGGRPPSDTELDDGKRYYSFKKDANLIYAAFQQTHGINLKTAQLHWWEFLALFDDLGAETSFSSLVHLRYQVKNDKAEQYEIDRAREIGPAFEIEDVDLASWQEKDAASLHTEAFNRAFYGEG
ncbi:MAG: Gp15 family bacteriophage protein [Anaerolineaceae bacterium]|nr:Gp15 family bacteriophage protein [Anaerolineaceae bacterium]